MPAGQARHSASAWFVRRAGLARCTTIAVAIGLALAAAMPGRYELAIIGLASSLTGMLAGQVLVHVRPLPRAGLGTTLLSVVLVGLLGGFLIGTVRVSALLESPLTPHLGARVKAEITVTGPVRSASGWQSATAVVDKVTDGLPAGTGTGEKVLLEVAPASGALTSAPREATAVLGQGMLLSVNGVLRAPDGPSPSGFDQSKQLIHQGIQVVLQVKGDAGLTVRGHREGVVGWFDRVRKSAKEHLSLGPDARVNEVLKGVVMGDASGIDEEWMDAFRRSGTAHMLSVSGLHVASLAAIIVGLAGLAGLSRRAGLLLAAGAALLLIPLVGSSPPIVRSAVMIIVVLGGRWVGRRRDPWQGLAFAALVVLVLNPLAVFDVGFQLSFSAFAGMLALAHPLERALRGLSAAVRTNLAVSVAATLGTAPVSLAVFGRTSLVSPLANLLVVPTLAPVTGLGMASVLLGFIWRGFSVPLDALASLPMSWTIVVSSLCARAPILNAGDIGRAAAAMICAAVAVPPAFALSGRVIKFPRRLNPPLFGRTLSWLHGHRPRDRRRALAAGCVVVVVALFAGGAAYPAAAGSVRSLEILVGSQRWPADVEIRMLDVGQGTAVLVRTPQHHAALFDAGPAGCDLAGQLRGLGVDHLDLVVISHPHADHFAGLLDDLGSLAVGTLVDSTEIVPAPGVADEKSPGSAPAIAKAATAGGASGEAGQYLRLVKRLVADGSRRLRPSPGSSLRLDDVRVTFFGPTRPLTLVDCGEPWGRGREPPSGDELNGTSLVAVLRVGGLEVLLPGDAEAEVLEEYLLPAVDGLVVSHHGSRGAVSQRLLARLGSRVALISVGEDNSFGHPHPETLSLLAGFGDVVLRTDDSGWVSLRMEDGEIRVSTERTQAR
jgi:competence protein ComEC